MIDPLGALMMMAGAAMMRPPAKSLAAQGLQFHDVHSTLVKANPVEPLNGFEPDLVRKVRSLHVVK